MDENLPRGQQRLLERWGIRARQIGYDISYRGIQDEEILPLLHRLNLPSLFTRDLGLYRRRNCHPNYCIICIDASEEQAPSFVRRVLRHRRLNTHRKRVGKIIRVTDSGIKCWHAGDSIEHDISWGK